MFTCQNKGDYLLVEISGPYSLEMLMSAVHEVADQCRKESLNKVLIDLRNMDGDPSILDRYQIGVEIASIWGPRYKVAVIARTEIVNKMTENTAVNRGAKFMVTPDANRALEWLGIQR